jgi:TRAP transporter TAXI family solute receptor
MRRFVMTSRALRLLAGFLPALLWGPAVCAGEAHWPDALTLGTAARGGTYYAYGEGLAGILTRALDLPVVMRPTEGPAENIALMEAGDAQLGFVTIGVALHAWNGTGVWAGRKPAQAMRAIFPMYDTPFHFAVLQDAEAKLLTDLAGKRVGVGPRGGTTATYAPDFFAALKTDATFVYGDWPELTAQLQERTIDAIAAGAGVPFPAFADLERKTKVRYLPLTSDQIGKLRLAMPELTPSRIPAGTYWSLNRLYPTVGLYNFAVAHRDLPEDLVYQLVKAVFENHERMIEVHPAAAESVPTNMARNSFLPLHPGAIRYFRQIGSAGQTD